MHRCWRAYLYVLLQKLPPGSSMMPAITTSHGQTQVRPGTGVCPADLNLPTGDSRTPRDARGLLAGLHARGALAHPSHRTRRVPQLCSSRHPRCTSLALMEDDGDGFGLGPLVPVAVGAADAAGSTDAGAAPSSDVDDGSPPKASQPLLADGAFAGADGAGDDGDEGDGGKTGDPRSRPWTTEEDAMVRSLVEEHGTKRWSVIAASLPGRTGKQCRERWHNQLDPAIKKDIWSPEGMLHAHRRLAHARARGV